MIIQQDDFLTEPSEMAALTELKAVLTKKHPENMKAFVKYVFDTSRRIRQQATKYSQLSDGVCMNRPLGGYRCYDCSTEAFILCEECFLRGQHQNHRYRRVETEDMCCCGRESKIDRAGFCPNHNGEPNPIQIDRDIAQRLQKGLITIFQQLFNFCELLNYEYGYLLPQETSGPRRLQTLSIQKHIHTIMEMLSIFCHDFCRQMAPILRQVALNMIKKRQIKRFHNCNKQNLESTFKGSMKDTGHICQKSLLEQIFIYSIFLSSKSRNLTRFLQSMFISQPFQKHFGELYTSHYKFIVSFGQFPNSQIHQMYRYFDSKWQIQMLVSPVTFENIFYEMKIYQQGLQKPDFQRVYTRSIIPLIEMLKHISQKASRWRLQMQSFKILHELVRQSFQSIPIGFKSLAQHKIRIQTDHYILALANNLIGSISLNNHHSKKLMQGLIFMYLNEKQTQISQTDVNSGALAWYTLPERILGSVLLTHYMSYGYKEAKQLFDKIFDEKTTQAIIKQLLRSLEAQQKLLVPTATPLQQTITDILEEVLRNPTSQLFDCDMICLQMFAILSQPELYVKYLFDVLSPQVRPKILLQLVLQQSYFINITSAMGLAPNVYLLNAKKLYLINSYNIQNTFHQTMHSISQLFDRSVFDMRCVTFQDVIHDVADYDRKRKSFVIKTEYQGFMFIEPLYFERNRDLVQMLSPTTQPVTYDEFSRNSLLRKQTEKDFQTFCFAVTEGISKSLLFMSNVMMKSFRELWAQKDSDNPNVNATTFRKLKILQVFLLRNTSNLQFMKFFESESSHSANQSHRLTLGKTEVQNILLELLAQFENDYFHAVYDKEEKGNGPGAPIHQRKPILEIKEMRKKFMESISQNPLKQVINSKQCILCKTQDHTNILWSGIRFIKSIISKPNQLELTFQSCGHWFHKECLQQNFEDFVCPHCKQPFPVLVPDISKGFCFYRKQRIALHITLQRYKPKCESSFKDFELHFQKIRPFTLELIEDLIVTRLQLSTELIPQDFYETHTLKSLFCIYLMKLEFHKKQLKLFDKQSINNAITINDQLLVSQIQQNRAEAYSNLLRLIIRMPFIFDSVQCLRLYQRIVSKYFNAMLAVNMYDYYKGQTSTYTKVNSVFTASKNIHLGNLTSFCRGAFYAYSLAYDDPDFTKLTECWTAIPIIEQNPSLFNIDLQMVSSLIFIISKGSRVEISRKELLFNPTIIDLPSDYQLFHQLYYGKPCDLCHGFPLRKHIRSLMCLECGFRFCSNRCSTAGSGKQHISNLHGNSTALIDIETGSVLLHQEATIEYGHLYLNKMGQWNQSVSLEWQTLKLDQILMTQIKRLIHCRQIASQIAVTSSRFIREGLHYIPLC